MALANVAWLLAASGRKVLAVDWDLEAPGLHRYFLPYLDDPELTRTEGLLDLLWRFVDTAASPRKKWPDGINSPFDLADLERVAIRLKMSEVPDAGALAYVPAGRQDSDYAKRLHEFDWRNFYGLFGGERFVDALKDRAEKQGYEYLLIDSRTGVADTTGICTIQLPDTVVLCFTYNRQSINGAAAVGQAIREQKPDMRMWPVAMRVDPRQDLIERARRYARTTLDFCLPVDLPAADRAAHWEGAEITYDIAYAYQEALAAFRDPPRRRDTRLADMIWLARHVVGDDAVRSPALDEETRSRLVLRYEFGDPILATLEEIKRLDATERARILGELARSETTSHSDADSAHQLVRAIRAAADDLRRAGQSDEASRASNEAVTLARTLAASRPDAFLPDLAASLNNLSDHLFDLARREAALAAVEEAVTHNRALAAARPDAFLPDLAASLNHLSVLLSTLGQPDAALDAVEEAVTHYRALAASRPEEFELAFVLSLTTHVHMLWNLGRGEAAEAAAREALGICHKLAAARPEESKLGLTVAVTTLLTTLANVLGDLGGREAAEAAAHDAVRLCRKLATACPDEFEPGLAMSLINYSNRLNELGRREEALSAASEAVGLFRKLATARPEAFEPGLAMALNNHAAMLGELDRREEAVDVHTEAIMLLRPYFLALPTAHQKLMDSLVNNYSHLSKATNQEPDRELLAPVVAKLAELNRGKKQSKER